MKVNSITALGIILVAGLLVGCDSKPTVDTSVAPPPPEGHETFAQQKNRTSTPAAPGTTTPGTPGTPGTPTP